MRRDDFRLEVSNVAWLEGDDEPRQPTLTIRADLPPDELRSVLGIGPDGGFEGSDVDVTFRFRDGRVDGSVRGVLAFADRMTGEFLIEVNAPGEEIMTFVAAGRRYAEGTEDGAQYQARVLAEEERVVDLKKRTLLVYSADGELLRERSLIPSGVEI